MINPAFNITARSGLIRHPSDLINILWLGKTPSIFTCFGRLPSLPSQASVPHRVEINVGSPEFIIKECNIEQQSRISQSEFNIWLTSNGHYTVLKQRKYVPFIGPWRTFLSLAFGVWIEANLTVNFFSVQSWVHVVYKTSCWLIHFYVIAIKNYKNPIKQLATGWRQQYKANTSRVLHVNSHATKHVDSLEKTGICILISNNISWPGAFQPYAKQCIKFKWASKFPIFLGECLSAD